VTLFLILPLLFFLSMFTFFFLFLFLPTPIYISIYLSVPFFSFRYSMLTIFHYSSASAIIFAPLSIPSSSSHPYISYLLVSTSLNIFPLPFPAVLLFYLLAFPPTFYLSVYSACFCCPSSALPSTSLPTVYPTVCSSNPMSLFFLQL
jgi:hypothetical protein